jgi:hypothetical protein
MDRRKAEGTRFTVNLVAPDSGETFIVGLENATLTTSAASRLNCANHSDCNSCLLVISLLNAFHHH